LVYVEKRERDFQFKGVTLGKIQKKICHWLWSHHRSFWEWESL
jgi:hypothetical protein